MQIVSSIRPTRSNIHRLCIEFRARSLCSFYVYSNLFFCSFCFVVFCVLCFLCWRALKFRCVRVRIVFVEAITFLLDWTSSINTNAAYCYVVKAQLPYSDIRIVVQVLHSVENTYFFFSFLGFFSLPRERNAVCLVVVVSTTIPNRKIHIKYRNLVVVSGKTTTTPKTSRTNFWINHDHPWVKYVFLVIKLSKWIV